MCAASRSTRASRLENQLVCRQETLARIEGALASLLAPRRADVTLDGLRVRVRLAGPPNAALARLIARTLRTHVCEDLEIDPQPQR